MPAAPQKLPMYNRSKQESTVQFVANGRNIQELSRGGILQFLACKLTGQLTLAGASNTVANTLKGDVMGCIKRLRVRLNSQENVVELDAGGLIWDQFHHTGVFPRDMNGKIGDGATTNPAFNVPFLICFTTPRRRVRKPIDTALDLRAEIASKAEIEVDWNDHLSINASATGFTVNPTIVIRSQKLFDVPANFRPGFMRRYLLQQTLAATNPREIVRLAATQSYYGFYLNFTSGTPAVDNSAVLSSLQLVSGSQILEDHDAQILNHAYTRAWQGRMDPAVLFGLAAGGSQTSKPVLVSPNFNVDAWYELEIPADGNLTEMQPAQALADFQLLLNATAGGAPTIENVYPLQYVVPALRG